MAALVEIWRNQRARHVAIAAAIAFLLGIADVLMPVSTFTWAMQSRFSPRDASGEIVFIGAKDDLADPTNPQRRAALARLLVDLAEYRPAKVFLNTIFDSPGTPASDRALRAAISSTPTVLVSRHTTTVNGEETIGTIPAIAGDAPAVISKEWVDALGFTPRLPYSVMDGGKTVASLPAAIAGRSGPSDQSFPVDYSVRYSTIPTFTLDKVAELIRSDSAAARQAFTGKTIVIGSIGGNSSGYATIPRHPKVPPSLVSIYGAETLIHGLPIEFSWFQILLLYVAGVAAVALLRARRRVRHIGYAVLALSMVALVTVFVSHRVPANVAVAITFLLIYAGLRLWVIRQQSSALVDGLTGLPTFRALERDMFHQGAVQTTAVVVAKVHHFDEVLSALPADKHATYVHMIGERLRITQRDLKVYTNGGRYLAWAVQDHGDLRLEAHLRGLRAVFGTPLTIGGTTVDVVITFGVDSTTEASPARKIASATTAADKTSESLLPIRFADAASEADRIWNISLQAKIDEALKTGQIYVVYQPQINLRSGGLYGAEALVRWEDPERGSISPSYFIEQCEQAGRMEALTRKVMRDAVTALAESPLANRDFQMSINVSATLLSDHRIAEILEETLAAFPIAPSQLMLEITETARIVDYEKARLVMERLRRTGVGLSIDDFGVGAASLETFLALPFDELKIDRCFVASLPGDRKARKIVESLVLLGQNLGLIVVAEGVENQEVVERLNSLGCPVAQGYFFARPGEFSRLLEFATPPEKPQKAASSRPYS
ncbi:conserved hypothetical protein [Altererythrobacter sp. B11]|uniref:EAL domain-containing protein n=1 Tax=Altererythrobacter sp. B11 TaxID=2060312 RepID=UPI000DC6E695|nr:EAL domain-containing protein [Altererythrobacter sp. B11]BBC72136.1 conserved hypothetical protein [Altererythrobacter sp. B11]